MRAVDRQHGQQPTTLKLTVNRLSRHKISRHFYHFGSRTRKVHLLDKCYIPVYNNSTGKAWKSRLRGVNEMDDIKQESL